ncbi:MAG: DUF5652 family protein [Nanobdellota archaeon]
MAYLNEVATQLGISLWLLVVIFIWSAVWKLLALWKSARKNHLAWFIVLAILNTVGILEILYIYVFSESKPKAEKEQKKPAKKRR